MPVHVERLSRRLALGMDGISLAYTCSANGACGGSATRSGLNVHGGRAQLMRRCRTTPIGRLLRSLLGAVEAGVEFIPPTSAWRAECPVSRSVRNARLTGATSAEESWSFALFVAPVTTNLTVTKMSTPAVYEGRGAALPSGYKSLGETHTWWHLPFSSE